MNDGMLSQEEINALLAVSQDDQGEVNEGASGESDEEKEIEVSKYLSSIEVDTLGEIGNISFGSSFSFNNVESVVAELPNEIGNISLGSSGTTLTSFIYKMVDFSST